MVSTKYLSFYCEDSAGFNGSLYLMTTTDTNNVFSKAVGTDYNLLWTKNVGTINGHCGAINYIFDKYFPEYRSQKPSCLTSPQIVLVYIDDGHGIYQTNGEVYFANGEHYKLTTQPTTIHSFGRFKGKKPPIQRFVRLNDFTNSKLTYIGKRPKGLQ